MEAFSYQQNHPGNFFGDQVYFQVGEMSNASSSSCFTSYNNYSSDVEVIPTPQASSDNKRKQSTDHGSCLSNTGQYSKGGKGISRGRKQKKGMNGELKAKSKELKAAKSDEEPPSGYIHVRARRGQATDSHSLAERVRRERISERMKKLQSLVPGCDKVTGKALVLDEIINYVQSLHNQVEFLSMKLASANPVVYNFAADDYAELMIQQEEVLGSMSQPMPSAIQQTPSTTFGGTTDNSIAFSLQGHGPTNFSDQNGGSFISQAGFHNMCSFQ